MTLPGAKNVATSLLVAINSLIGLAILLSWVNWSTPQGVLVFGTANAVIWFVVSVYAHTLSGTSQEPVNLAGSFVAVVVATLLMLAAFNVVHVTEKDIEAIAATLTLVLGAIGTGLARGVVKAKVTP